MPKWPMDVDSLKQIEKILGRAIPASEEDSINSFLDFTEEDLVELRKLEAWPGLFSHRYVAFRMKGRTPLPIVQSFGEAVLHRGQTVEEWLPIAARLKELMSQAPGLRGTERASETQVDRPEPPDTESAD